MNLSDRLVASPGVVARQVAGETVLLDLAGGSYFGLDEVGGRIWQWLAEPGAGSLGELADRLAQAYSISRPRAEEDLLALARSLAAHGLVLLAPDQPPAS